MGKRGKKGERGGQEISGNPQKKAKHGGIRHGQRVPRIEAKKKGGTLGGRR